MDRILIRGGRVLSGSIPISGAKNAALPLMAAGLLSDGPLTLTNAPDLADVTTMAGLLGHHGLTVSRDTNARSITISGDFRSSLAWSWVYRSSFWRTCSIERFE